MNELKRSALTALAYSAVCSLTSWAYLVAYAYDFSLNSDADFFIWIALLIMMALGYPFVEHKMLGDSADRNDRLRFGVLFFTLSVPLSLINLFIGANLIFNVFYPKSAQHGFLAGIEFAIVALFHELMFAAAIVVRLIWAFIVHIKRSGCAAV